MLDLQSRAVSVFLAVVLTFPVIGVVGCGDNGGDTGGQADAGGDTAFDGGGPGDDAGDVDADADADKPDASEPDAGSDGGGADVVTGSVDILDATLSDNPNSTISTYLEVSTSAPAFIEVRAQSADHSFTLTFDGKPLEQRRQLLIGFRAEHTYTLTVRAYTSGGAQASAELEYTTGALPADMTNYDVLVDEPSRMQPGMTLFGLWRWNGPGKLDSSEAYIVGMDNEAEIVWYYKATHRPDAIEVLASGDIAYNWGFGNVVVIDLAGDVQDTYNYQDLGLNAIHHDVIELPNGNLAVLSSEVRTIGGYTDAQGNPATYNVVGDIVAEFTRNGQLVHAHSMLDVLDPHRRTSSFDADFWDSWYADVAPSGTKDWAHANSVVYDARDDSFIVSLRHLNMAAKIDRATGALIWRLGEDADFKLTSGEWFYHEHAVDLTPSGNIIMFDNGNGRPGVQPGQYFSRAVEYAIDPSGADPSSGSKGTATQVWEFRDTQPFYSSFLSDANKLANGDVLIADGGRFDDVGDAQNLATARLIEVTGDANPQKVFEVHYRDASPPQVGYSIYRAERVDLIDVLESR